MPLPRRRLFKGLLVGAAFPVVAKATPPAVAAGNAAAAHAWGVGAGGQRKADRGDGTFLNPIFSGDHADPTVLKDGENYYMTFSSFYSYPGLVIWRSTDLVNWAPVGSALRKPLGPIWAVDLVKHDGRYFIYVPADPEGKGWSIFVIWAEIGRAHV